MYFVRVLNRDGDAESKATKWDTGGQKGGGLRMAVLNGTNAAFYAVILRIQSSLNPRMLSPFK